MRNLKRLATSLVALVLVLAFSSCEKQPATNSQGELSFNIKNVTESLKKGTIDNPYADTLPTCSDATAAYVMIGLNGDNPVRLNILTGLNDGTETQVMKFIIDPDSPDQVINSFMVYDALDNMIWATPNNGSKFQLLWGLDGVDKTFTPVAFTKSVIDIDVICWEEYSYKEFGFNWFEFHEVTVKTLCFFGDVCTKFYDSFYGVDGSPYFQDGYIDGTGKFDMPAIMSVYIKDAAGNVVNDTDNDVHNNWKHADGTLWQGEGAPLCIEYPYFADADEALTFEIWLMYPDGTENLVYTSDPFMASDDQSTITGDDGVFDFVVGNCSYDGNTTNVELPPYLYLPTLGNITVHARFNNASPNYSYFDVDLNGATWTNVLFPEELVEGATLPAYCGDLYDLIPGNSTYDCNVYSSLKPEDMPSPGDPGYGGGDTKAYKDYPWGALNWLANQQDIIETQTASDGEYLQALLWLTIHNEQPGITLKVSGKMPTLSFSDVALMKVIADNMLTDQVDFIPETGQFSFVLFDPIEGSGPSVSTPYVQLVLVRVDP